MDHSGSNVPGVISWIELATTDQEAAKAFYGALFNWTVEDNPMGPGSVYSTFLLQGRKAAACYTLMDEQKAQGVPPHWEVYVAVTSADDTAKRAAELGGKILAGPFDVMNHGRMAMLQDPEGAVFALWQPIQHHGLQIRNEPGSLCWVDLSTPDQASGVQFYSKLFGWEVPPTDDGYLHIRNGEEFIGGIPSAAQRDPNAPAHWMIYLQVDNCDRSTQKASELGAKVCIGPVSMENVGRFTILSDPQGAFFALFQPERRG